MNKIEKPNYSSYTDVNENTIDYPLIKSNTHQKKLQFGSSNESLLLISEAYPTNYASHAKYVIPIMKFTLN